MRNLPDFLKLVDDLQEATKECYLTPPSSKKSAAYKKMLEAKEVLRLAIMDLY